MCLPLVCLPCTLPAVSALCVGTGVSVARTMAGPPTLSPMNTRSLATVEIPLDGLRDTGAASGTGSGFAGDRRGLGVVGEGTASGPGSVLSQKSSFMSRAGISKPSSTTAKCKSL